MSDETTQERIGEAAWCHTRAAHASALDVDYCGKRAPGRNVVCTRPVGHPGAHIACGTGDDRRGHNYAAWRDGAATEEGTQ